MPYAEIRLSEISFEALTQANDGEYDAMLKQALRQAVADCADKPLLDKERTVTFTIRMKPVLDKSSHAPRCEQIKTALDLKTNLPKTPLRSIDLQVKERRDGSQQFAYGAISTTHAHDAKQSEIADLQPDDAA